MSEFRVGSAPGKSFIHLMSEGSALTSPDKEAEVVSGFLNRKCIKEAGSKSRKDKQWQALWCNLKGTTMDFYRVEGVRAKAQGEPPPKDVYPPPNLMKYKMGYLLIDNAIVELDYTSQMNKDIQKRRRHLFRILLPNSTEYLLQAPSDNQRTNWVLALQNAARRFEGDDSQLDMLIRQELKIKTTRCSIKQRSRQNVYSIKSKAGPSLDEPDMDSNYMYEQIMTDPRLHLLKTLAVKFVDVCAGTFYNLERKHDRPLKRLQQKRDLLRQFERMYQSFAGNVISMYAEGIPAAKPSEPGLHSLSMSSFTPNHQLNTLCDDESFRGSVVGSESRRSSTGEVMVPVQRINLSEDVISEITGIQTLLLQDYYLVPGAEWSLLKRGEVVQVLGKLPSGWFRCLARQSIDCHLDPLTLPSQSVLSGLSEMSGDSGIPSEVQSVYSGDSLTFPITSAQPPEDSILDGSIFPNDELENGVVKEKTPVLPQIVLTGSSPRELRHRRSSLSLERTPSYKTAVEEVSFEFEDHGPPKKTKSQPNLHELCAMTPLPKPTMGPPQIKISSLLEQERATRHYLVPLVGCIPPSVLDLPEDLPLSAVSPTNLYQLLRSHSSEKEENSKPPTNGYTHLRPEVKHTRSSSLPAPTFTSPPLSPEHIAQRPISPTVPTRRSPSPIPTNRRSSSPRRSQTFTPADTHLASPGPSLSAQISPVRKPLVSPVRSANKAHVRRRKSSESSALDTSGPTTLLKKLFSRRRPLHTKQISLPNTTLGSNSQLEDQSHAPRSPSPTQPPPPPLLLDDDFGGVGMRLRVESMSGRPVHSTGMGLVFGGDSSSESESEETESPHSSTGTISPVPASSVPVTLSPLHADDSTVFTNQPDTHKEASIPKSASDHDSLKLKAEPEQEEDQSKVDRAYSSLPSKSKMQASKTKSHSQSTTTPPKKGRSTQRRRRGSYAEAMSSETPKVTGIFREPPRGEKRFVFLDPQQPKFGFKLESYGRMSERGRVLQTFVQSVAPGSPAFMGGLYPGDTITEVNGESVKYAPVEEVVGAITRVPRRGNDRIKLTVEFVDGVTRLERMKKADELKYQIRAMQSQLKDLITKETALLSATLHLPSPVNVVLTHELPPWELTAPLTRPKRGPYPYNRHMNSVVAVHSGSITALACDALVLPLSSCFRPQPGNDQDNVLHQFLHTGGSELVDELSLARQCRVGQNIHTHGHKLPACNLYHCVFGDLEESLLSCCRHALEVASSKRHQTIVFWVDGFIAISVSPHIIIETVRLWLQEELNGRKFERVVFSATANSTLLEKCMNTYFPLQPAADTDSILSSESFTQSQGGEAGSRTSSEITSGSIVQGQEERIDEEMEKNEPAAESLQENEVSGTQSSEQECGNEDFVGVSQETEISPEPSESKEEDDEEMEKNEPASDSLQENEVSSTQSSEQEHENEDIVGASQETEISPELSESKKEDAVTSKRLSTTLVVEFTPYQGEHKEAANVGTLEDVISRLEEAAKVQSDDELLDVKASEEECTDHSVADPAAIEDLDSMLVGLQVLTEDLDYVSSNSGGPTSELTTGQASESLEEDVHLAGTGVHILNPTRIESDV